MMFLNIIVLVTSCDLISNTFIANKAKVFTSPDNKYTYGVSVSIGPGNNVYFADPIDGNGKVHQLNIDTGLINKSYEGSVSNFGFTIIRSYDKQSNYVFAPNSGLLKYYIISSTGELTELNFEKILPANGGNIIAFSAKAMVGNILLISDLSFNGVNGRILRYDLNANVIIATISYVDVSDNPAIPGMFGRIISIGKFFTLSGEDVIICSEITKGSFGGLYIFMYAASSRSYFKMSELKGPRIDSGFGTSVATIRNRNQNSYDFIAVGIPFDYTNGYESGGILFYLCRANTDAKLLNTIYGEQYSRLGMYLYGVSSLDNSDLIDDLIVFAPNENEGTMYIYDITTSGMNQDNFYKINVLSLNGKIPNSFGISLDFDDLNGDGYTDLVIGSQGSVIYFENLPTATLVWRIDNITVNIPSDSSCLYMGYNTVCKLFNICVLGNINVNRNQEISISIFSTQADSTSTDPLSRLVDSGYVFDNGNSYTNFTVTINTSVQDFQCVQIPITISPFSLNRVITFQASAQQSPTNIFFKEPLLSNNFNLNIVRDCSVLSCDFDISLSSNASVKIYDKKQSSFSLYLNIIAQQGTDISIEITLPENIVVTFVNPSISLKSNANVFIILIANKLNPNLEQEPFKVDIYLMPDNFNFSSTNFVPIICKVTSNTNENNLSNNNIQFNADLISFTTPSLTTILSKSETSFTQEKMKVNPKYMNYNANLGTDFQISFNITNLDKVTTIPTFANIILPYMISEKQIAYFMNVKDDGQILNCQNLNNKGGFYSLPTQNNLVQNCTFGSCYPVRCIVPSISAFQFYIFNISIKLDPYILENSNFFQQQNSEYNFSAYIEYAVTDNQELIPLNSAYNSIHILLITTTKEPVPYYIILPILSIVLVLIMIILIIFYKNGFFKRKHSFTKLKKIES